MKKTNNKGANCQSALKDKHGEEGAVMSPGREDNDPAVEALELGRRIFEKLVDVEDLIEIIAREIKRQLDRQQ